MQKTPWTPPYRLKTTDDRLTLKAAEKAIRLPAEHPRRLALEDGNVGNRCKTLLNWRTEAQIFHQSYQEISPQEPTFPTTLVHLGSMLLNS